MTFRLIDVERAHVGKADDAKAAADLATLSASVADGRLRAELAGVFLDTYLAARRSLRPGVDFRTLLSRASPTKSF